MTQREHKHLYVDELAKILEYSSNLSTNSKSTLLVKLSNLLTTCSLVIPWTGTPLIYIISMSSDTSLYMLAVLRIVLVLKYFILVRISCVLHQSAIPMDGWYCTHLHCMYRTTPD